MTEYVEFHDPEQRRLVQHIAASTGRTLCGQTIPRKTPVYTTHPVGRVCTKCELANMERNAK